MTNHLDETALAAAMEAYRGFDPSGQHPLARAITAYHEALPVGEYGEQVARLRNWPWRVGDGDGPVLATATHRTDCDEAATAIETLVLRESQARAEAERLRTALKDIAQSGPVNHAGNDDPMAGWAWCYDRAGTALEDTSDDG